MLERRRAIELVPNYSLTGDLLSYMRCGLQYRYQNGSALPPSRPVQMWFGEFIHGVMETAYRLWSANQVSFPWPCTPTPFNAPTPPNRVSHDIGSIGDLVEATLSAAGKSPRSRDLRDSGYKRAELAVNEIGPALFPLIRSVEERVIGTRQLVMPAGVAGRAHMYELHGVMDVLSSVTVAAAHNNVICDAVRAVIPNLPNGAEVIVDYKGSRRPPTTCPPSMSDYWAHGDWQLHMYAWLRSQQPGAAPVVAGVLLYVNELALSGHDIGPLQREVSHGHTDVCPVPGSQDDYLLRTWRSGAAAPAFSHAFRMARVVRVVPITQPSINQALQRFDAVVADIETCVAHEAHHGKIMAHWPACGDDGTCDACDFRHFCPSPASARPAGKPSGNYTPQAPNAP
ncbi:PD-(D/E)XK nuclease family protein [Sorangium sp. So ce233]|uniref:PD-(D/E)XK nuclease family protein n=1 Tax=Sorangium sp. So ce233 TaxID=3133290 RepID=UPI003F61C65D